VPLRNYSLTHSIWSTLQFVSLTIWTYTATACEDTNPQINAFLSSNLLCKRTSHYAAIVGWWSSRNWSSWWRSRRCRSRSRGRSSCWSGSRRSIRRLVILKRFNVIFWLDNDTQRLKAQTTGHQLPLIQCCFHWRKLKLKLLSRLKLNRLTTSNHRTKTKTLWRNLKMKKWCFKWYTLIL